MRTPGASPATPYLFLLPFFVAFAAFWIIPIVASFAFSFTSWSGLTEAEFVGLANYRQLLGDRTFWRAMTNTFLYVFVYNAIMLPLATVIALVLDSGFKRIAPAFRTAYFIPVTVSLVVVALVFDLLFNREFGPVNDVLGMLGIGANPNWLNSSTYAPWTIVIMRVWRATGYYSAFIFAGLQSIPRELIEAARIDGASEIQVFRRIIVPTIRGSLITVATTIFIVILKVFDIVFVTTGGRFGSDVIANRMFQELVRFRNPGLASALAVVLLVAVVPVMVINVRNLRRQGVGS